MATKNRVWTEARWNRSKNLEDMTTYLRRLEPNDVTARKARLYGVACCHRIWEQMDYDQKLAVNYAQDFADGKLTQDGLAALHQAHSCYSSRSDMSQRQWDMWVNVGQAVFRVTMNKSFDHLWATCVNAVVTVEVHVRCRAEGIDGSQVCYSSLWQELPKEYCPILREVFNPWRPWSGMTYCEREKALREASLPDAACRHVRPEYLRRGRLGATAHPGGHARRRRLHGGVHSPPLPRRDVPHAGLLGP